MLKPKQYEDVAILKEAKKDLCDALVSNFSAEILRRARAATKVELVNLATLIDTIGNIEELGRTPSDRTKDIIGWWDGNVTEVVNAFLSSAQQEEADKPN